jgi:hypothetical protein
MRTSDPKPTILLAYRPSALVALQTIWRNDLPIASNDVMWFLVFSLRSDRIVVEKFYIFRIFLFIR